MFDRLRENGEYRYFFEGKPNYHKKTERSDYEIAIETAALDSWQQLGWRIYYDYAMTEGWFGMYDIGRFEGVFYGNAVELIRYISLKNGRTA